MTSPLKNQIREDMKAALRAQDKQRLGTIRLLMAEIKQREIDDQIELDDTGIFGVIGKMIKQRKDSITQYKAGNRKDLADKEEQEIDVLKQYLPQQLSDAEIDKAIQAAIEKSGASSIKDIGKVMGVLKSTLQGRADMGMVSARVKAHFQ